MDLRRFFGELSYSDFHDAMLAIANSYKSGGAEELTAVVRECGRGIPALHALRQLYVRDRKANEQAIHYIQTLCAIYRIAESKGYEW